MDEILVIEGYEDVRELISAILEKAGYHVVLASNGEGGLYVLRAEPDIRAVILNSFLSDMSGYEFATAVKLEFTGIKLVLFTGASAEEAEQRAFDAGFNAVLYKPTGVNYIAETIRDLLSS